MVHTVCSTTIKQIRLSAWQLNSSHIALYHGDTLLTSAGSLPQKGYETLSVVSNTGINLRVELSLSSDYIEQDLAGLQRLVKLFLALILLVICLWVIIFSWRLARPFNQISDVLYETGLLMGSASSQTKYSIDTLVGDIKKMGIKLSDYGRIIEEQNSRRRINILEKALYRGLYDEASRQSFLEAFPDFPARWQLAFIQYIPNEDPADLNYVQLLLSQQLAQKLPETILLPYSQDTLLAFIPAGDEASPAKALEEARTYIQEQYPVSLSFTVGPIYDHYSLLPDAFQQLEYETITLRHFASPTVHRKDLPIPVQQLQAIYLALQNGDGQSAVSALRNGCADFRDSTSLDLATAKYSHQMIVYTLIRLKLENNILDIPIPNFRREDIRRLFDVELPACFAQFAARLNQQRTDQMKNLDRTIFAFIDKNIGNQQLCISMVTDHFQISAPTLQKRMNACCGKTFSSYVEDSRMKKAGEMLLDTSLNIQEIAEAVGYTTANSFYKAYKRYYGEAPRETRQNKLHQQ